jgi:DNA-binding transcriptional LysR family regulator
MALTPDGEKIYAQVKDSKQTLISVERNLKQTEILNLGIHTNMPKEIYRTLLSKIKQKNYNIEINIEKAPTEDMFSMLEKQKIDAYLSKKQPEDIHSESIKFIKLGDLHDSFFVNSNSQYLDKNIITSDDKVTIYTLRNISSTSRNLESLLKEKKVNNITIKNATFNTIIEEMQNKDIIAYITEEYVQEELKNGKLKKLELNIESPDIEYGIYYNSNNKIKNIKRLFNSIK